MKIIFNKILPFKGFMAITILNMIFVRDKYKGEESKSYFKKMLKHESIHFEQEKELGFIFFYIFYIIEWIFKCLLYVFDARIMPYRSVSFEQEAFNNEGKFSYLSNRKRYSWIKYIFKVVR